MGVWFADEIGWGQGSSTPEALLLGDGVTCYSLMGLCVSAEGCVDRSGACRLPHLEER